MGITLLLYLCLSHHEDYFLGPVVKLPVKWSRGRSSICSSVCAKARGADKPAAETALGSEPPLSLVCPSLPEGRLLWFRSRNKKLPLALLEN